MAITQRGAFANVMVGNIVDLPLATAAGVQPGDVFIEQDAAPLPIILQCRVTGGGVKSWVRTDDGLTTVAFTTTDVAGVLIRTVSVNVKDGSGINVPNMLIRYDWTNPVGGGQTITASDGGAGTLLADSGAAGVGWAIAQGDAGGDSVIVLTATGADTWTLTVSMGEYLVRGVTEAWAP